MTTNFDKPVGTEIAELAGNIANLTGIVPKYIRKGIATSGDSITISVPKYCPYIMLITKANTSSTGYTGIYAGQSHNNGSIRALVEPASYPPTVSMSGTDITVTAATSNAMIVIMYFEEQS